MKGCRRRHVCVACGKLCCKGDEDLLLVIQTSVFYSGPAREMRLRYDKEGREGRDCPRILMGLSKRGM